MRDIRIYRITDAGPKGNQDACYVSEHDNGKALACIADGVSGQRDGKYTAEFIADYIEDWYDEEGDQIFRSQPETLKEKMLRLVMEMHEDLIAESDSSGLQPGSTLDLAVMGGRKVFVAHVGDSRVYLFDGRSMKRITEDQTVAEVEKTTGMKFNEIAESRKAHYLMQCIGIGKINPNIYEEDIPQNCDRTLPDKIFSSVEYKEASLFSSVNAAFLQNYETSDCHHKSVSGIGKHHSEEEAIEDRH